MHCVIWPQWLYDLTKKVFPFYSELNLTVALQWVILNLAYTSTHLPPPPLTFHPLPPTSTHFHPPPLTFHSPPPSIHLHSPSTYLPITSTHLPVTPPTHLHNVFFLRVHLSVKLRKLTRFFIKDGFYKNRLDLHAFKVGGGGWKVSGGGRRWVEDEWR